MKEVGTCSSTFLKIRISQGKHKCRTILTKGSALVVFG